jgi:mannose-6-phosphate isomerase-like protein (cupin superfamily)
MVHPVNRTTARHYTWGEACDGWHLVAGSALSVIEEQMPPGTTEVWHHHRTAQQFFYILSGEAVMEAGGARVRLAAGDGLWVPPGTQHQIRNCSPASVRFLVISQPPGHGDRVNGAHHA